MRADSHDAYPAFYEAPTGRGHVTRGLALTTLLALALGLLSACGGDDEPDSIAIDAEIEITAERDSAPTSTAAESDAMAAPDTAAASERVQLGNRFDWCADVQRVWDELDEAAVALAAAEVELDEAWRAQDSATDELDIAEATDAMFAADERFIVALSDYDSVAEQAVELLHLARGAAGTGTDAVAFRRAWEALTAADPAVASASEVVPADGSVPESPDQARRWIEGEVWFDLGFGLGAPTPPEMTSDEERLAWEREASEIQKAFDEEFEKRLAEVERRWKDYLHLEVLLGETVAGSPAYTAYKESFRESCA